MDINLDRLRYLDECDAPQRHPPSYSDPLAITHYLRQADLVLGSVSFPAPRAPRLSRANT